MGVRFYYGHPLISAVADHSLAKYDLLLDQGIIATAIFPIKLLLLRPSKNVDYCFKTVYSRIVLCDQTCDFVIILVIRLVIKLVDQLFTLCLSRAESIKKPSFQMPRLWTTVSKQTRMKMHKIMSLGSLKV